MVGLHTCEFSRSHPFVLASKRIQIGNIHSIIFNVLVRWQSAQNFPFNPLQCKLDKNLALSPLSLNEINYLTLLHLSVFFILGNKIGWRQNSRPRLDYHHNIIIKNRLRHASGPFQYQNTNSITFIAQLQKLYFLRNKKMLAL